MINFQEYLSQKYPTQERKEQAKEIVINQTAVENFSDTLTKQEVKEVNGKNLDLSEYPNLEILIVDGDCLKSKLTGLNISNCLQLTILGISRNQLTHLDLKNCAKLKELYCSKNSLTKLDLNPQTKLENLYIKDNNFSESDLSFLKWIKKGFSGKELNGWLDVGLQLKEDYNFVVYLVKQGYQSQDNLNLEELREKYNKSQGWLDKIYPYKEWAQIVYISQQLAGILDCWEYKNLEWIFISTSVDSSKFEIKKGSYKDWNTGIRETNVISCIPAQNYLDQAYSKNGTCVRKVYEGKPHEGNHWDFGKTRTEITMLDISGVGLERSLDLSDFQNLEELYIGNHDKIKIQQGIYNRFYGSLAPLKDLHRLKKLDISNTDLANEIECLPDSLEDFWYDIKLRPDCKLGEIKDQLDWKYWVDIHQDFAPKYKRGWLKSGFNKEQTKKFFEEWSQLGIEPKHDAFIGWFLNFKKLDRDWALENEEEFRELKNYDRSFFGTCEECQQPNTSYKWCRSCNAKHFQADFDKWTSGNQKIDKFIQKYQLEATSDWNVLEWIPYENFRDIEHIADGGFGKIYKAKWYTGPIWMWDSKKREWERRANFCKGHKTVALKILSNSQNLGQEFLREITLYKMFKSEVSNMVPCYGVSKDPAGNYIMVMELLEGDLRGHLKNYRELNLKRKLHFLKEVTQGLKDIHRKGLVHRDFHSGNVIVGFGEGSGDDFCRITDLGLSKPVNEKETKDEIYGLMPYVAPEVLRNRPYTQKSDIYSLGIIMYEILTSYPPFYQKTHDTSLALAICKGERPHFPSQVKYPQILVDLIKQCWDQEPNNRPTAREVSGIVREWFDERGNDLKKDTIFYQQYQKAEARNKTLPEEIRCPNYQTKETVYHSKAINTQQITNLLEKYQASKNLDLDLNDFNLDELNIQEDPQEQSSIQAQIEIPPK